MGISWDLWGNSYPLHGTYPLVICSIAMQSGWKWTIYFDDLPRKNRKFPGVVLNYQRICWEMIFFPLFCPDADCLVFFVDDLIHSGFILFFICLFFDPIAIFEHPTF